MQRLSKNQTYALLAPLLNASEFKDVWAQFVQHQIEDATARVINTPHGDDTVFAKIAEVKLWQRMLDLPRTCLEVSRSGQLNLQV